MKYPFVVLSLCNALVIPQLAVSTAQAEQGGTTAQPEQESTAPKSSDATLDRMVVTATRIKEKTLDIPASIQVITQEDIKNSPARDAGELMAEAGIGHVHKYNGALTSQVEIRGLSTNIFNETDSRVLLLVNGNRAGTTNMAKIPAGEIERIEIVKGPGSVLYGSQAMGGVINIITKSGTEEGVHGSAGAEGGSWGYWKSGGDLHGKQYGIDYFISGAASASDDYRTPKGSYDNNSYETEEISARLGYGFLGDQHVSVGFQRWIGRDIGTPGATYAKDPDDYSKKARNAFDFEYRAKSATLKYYINNNKDDSYSTGGMGMPGPGNSDRFTSNNRSQGVSIQNVFPIGVHRIILGGQWDRNAVDTSTSSGAPYYPDSRYDNYAVFAEGRLSLLNEKLLLTAGIRYDYFDNQTLKTKGLTSNPISKSMDHVTSRGGIVYKVMDGLSLKAAIGTAFRAPSPLELASDYTLYGYRTVGNRDLGPEKSTTYEGGFEYDKEHLKGGFTFFHTSFSHKIASYYDSALSATTYKNLSGATIQGVEMNVSYDAGLAAGLGISVEPFANLTYKTRYDGESKSSGSHGHLLYVPEWTGAFGIRAGQEAWDTRLVVNYTGDEYITDYSASYPYPVKNKGGFMIVDMKGAYRPLKNLELTLSVENLLNRYYEYINGYPMRARTFVGGAKWIF
jgi:vitamin B12 transporter